MLNLSVEDVTEDNIEKTDTILAGLAYQYAIDDMVHVTVLVSDTKAEQAIEDVLTAVGVGDIITGIKGHGILLIISLPISSGETSGYLA